ncbi:nucleotide-diphospho-sugar transferase [Ganoderma leucocontextum]|nr:nucleotide-diphospho-sugar transferase [Ganoderma leucocontextum]
MSRAMAQPGQPSSWRWPSFSYSQYILVPASYDVGQTTQVKSSLGRILQFKRMRFVIAVGVFACIFLVPILAPKREVYLDIGIASDYIPFTLEEIPLPGGVDWSRFAYSQYATDSAYLCNSLMFFASLHRLGSKAERLLMYPSNMKPDSNGTSDSRLLSKAQDEYGLVPIAVQHRHGLYGDSTWSDSYTKLLAFNQTQYDRVLALDSDSTLLQNMDELFLLPPAPVAIPRAYWLKGDPSTLTTSLILLQPSEDEFARVTQATETAEGGDFDMEIINSLYGRDCMVLPHRPYTLLTGEFRNVDPKGHAAYLGNEYEVWDADRVLQEAKFLHFSDWPMPKPWLAAPDATVNEAQPKCMQGPGGEEDSCSRELWLGFYSDFKTRRMDICGE